MIAIARQAVLTTPRLTIEPFTSAHAKRLVWDLADPHLLRFSDGFRPLGLRELVEHFRACGAAEDGQARFRMWAVFARSERRHVGTLEATVHEDGTVEIGYTVFSRFWRRGYALEACGRLLDHLFEDGSLPTVFLRVHAENAASRGLAERLGFRRAAPEREDPGGRTLHYEIERGSAQRA